MNERLKEAFGQIQAEEDLKDKTKDFLSQKTKGYTKKREFHYTGMIAALASFVLLVFGGYWFYFIPTVKISIDINPSVELGVNRLNHVISFKGYNKDGENLINTLDIKFMDYSEAVNKIIESEDIDSLLAKDEVLTIGVIGEDNRQTEKILSNIQFCTSKENNAHCYYACPQEVEKAHEMGLSYGKYRAFLEMQKLDSDITVEEIEKMTMRQIRNLIAELSDSVQSETEKSQNGKNREYRGHGDKHSDGHRSGEGYGKNRH